MFTKSSFVCESRQNGVARFLLWLTDAYIKNWCCKILIRFTEAYICILKIFSTN